MISPISSGMLWQLKMQIKIQSDSVQTSKLFELFYAAIVFYRRFSNHLFNNFVHVAFYNSFSNSLNEISTKALNISSNQAFLWRGLVGIEFSATRPRMKTVLDGQYIRFKWEELFFSITTYFLVCLEGYRRFQDQKDSRIRPECYPTATFMLYWFKAYSIHIGVTFQ